MAHANIPSIRIEIRPSKLIPGEVGLFAAKELPKDSLVAEVTAFDNIPYSWEVFPQLDANLQAKIMGFCSASETEFFGPKDFNYLPINWYMNHSCEPNVGFDVEGNFVAMRNIAQDEELTWDYAFDETNPKFKMDCHCNTSTCRKTITGNDWKFLKDDPEKYAYFSEDLRDFIKTYG